VLQEIEVPGPARVPIDTPLTVPERQPQCDEGRIMTIADLGEPVFTFSRRDKDGNKKPPMRVWVVNYDNVPSDAPLMRPTKVPGVWVVMAPERKEQNDEGNGKAQVSTAERIPP
jgi:hypothetical protein